MDERWQVGDHVWFESRTQDEGDVTWLGEIYIVVAAAGWAGVWVPTLGIQAIVPLSVLHRSMPRAKNLAKKASEGRDG